MMSFFITVSGALLLVLLGYLIGVKRYMHLISGYEPGKFKDDEAVARSFRIWCFGGAIVVLLASVVLRYA
jgi:hypothetical protein